MTTRLTSDELITLAAADALKEAWLGAASIYWEDRARQLEAARPRPGDFTGQATPEDLAERWRRLTGAAAACRARASGVDGWAGRVLAETALALQEDAA